ncbi:MAG: DASH family cryptochrome [Halieaceae bacterium]
MKTLYWFQNDLRLQDNPGLLAQADAGQLLLVYCWRENRPWCNLTGIGSQRERFLLESLQALRDELAPLQQNLVFVSGNPEIEIPRLVTRHRIDQVATTNTAGYYEQLSQKNVAKALTVPLVVHEGNTLFTSKELPFTASEVARQFTPFRKAVEALTIAAPADPIDTLPPPPSSVTATALPTSDTAPHLALPIRGGSAAGQRRLQQWVFEEAGISDYKQTRNCLDPLAGSSTLSPWLANGCVSARQIAHAVREYEAQHGANESTGWLIFELLWREFFYWRALADGANLFKASGIRGKLVRCTFEPRNFARWSKGDTNFPLVNALMRQLVATGWMSNRGRQIAASCLINEFGIDWRYGAAFFEKHLIDYDVGSNYGNWQYIAGVGTDPRGGRHFNLDKQAYEHDPDGEFTTKWGGHRPPQPDYVTDAADWPLPIDP